MTTFYKQSGENAAVKDSVNTSSRSTDPAMGLAVGHGNEHVVACD